MGYSEEWLATGDGFLHRPGLSRSIAGRDSLVYGTYEPSLANSGLLSTMGSLTELNSSTATTYTPAAGASISDKIIYGKVLPPSTVGAEFSNCFFPGSAAALSSGNDGVVNCTTTRSGQLKFYDCEIKPRKESAGRNCILGWQYELYRCYLHGGEDGAGVYNPGDANVSIKGCLIEDMSYFYPDTHADGSHCDGIQVQGGRNIEIIGNRINGTAHYMTGSGKYYPTHTSGTGSDLGDWLLEEWGINPGSGIIVQTATGMSTPDSTVKVNYNYIHFGKAQLLIKATAGTMQAIGNRFSAVDAAAHHVNGTVVGGVALNFTFSSYSGIRFDNTTTTGNIGGVTSGGAIVNTTNVWLDGPNAGVALSTPRANGIQNDNT